MKYGILLINTGIPDDTSRESVRAYAEAIYEHEDLVVGPDFIHKQILKRTVLPGKVKRWQAYLQNFAGTNPDIYHKTANSLVHKLQMTLTEQSNKDTQVAIGMRFGSPSTMNALQELREGGCGSVIVLPLYPIHYSPLTIPAIAAARKALSTFRGHGWKPQIKEVYSFYKTPSYKKALESAIMKDWEPRCTSRLLVLFPSLPKAISDRDQFYTLQIDEMMESINRRIPLSEQHLKASFVSDFDNNKWLKPFAEKTLISWGGGGINDLRLLCPVYTMDSPDFGCDIGVMLRQFFLANANGVNPNCTVIPSFGDDDLFVSALTEAVRKAIND